ncbi:MAG: hypothetical protein JWM28_3349 [Chitinophagaceae bacterium]|nr:hypothetical protein [Chitinophagaceae bacterium]
MTAPKEKIGSDTQKNFNSSSQISSLSRKYDISIDEIQAIFESNGKSISKTLEVLRAKGQPA